MPTITVRRRVLASAWDYMVINVDDDWEVNDHDIYEQTLVQDLPWEIIDILESDSWEIDE